MPGTGRARRRLMTAGVVAAAVAAFYAILYSPPVYQWGSAAGERAGEVAGDGIVTDPTFVATRSVTIAAPAEDVWPWLVQMGQDRGGFYTFDWAERLFTDPIHNADNIVPEWQNLVVGDFVHPFPPERGLPSWRVRQLVPERTLVLATDDSSWSWATELRPRDGARTRVVTRMRGQRTALSFVLDPADLIVFPRLLVGLEQRVEGTLPGMPGTFTGEPMPTARLPVHWWAAVAWIVGLAGFGAATGRALGLGAWRRRRPHPGVTLAVAFVAGTGYLLMSDTPPSAFLTFRPVVGSAVAAVLAGSGWWLLRRGAVAPAHAWRRVGRALVAGAEAGLLIVLPATAVWQAATGLGWTGTPATRVLTGLLAVAAAVGVAAAATRDWRPHRRHRLAFPALLATGLVASGAGLIPLVGAALVELLPATNRPATTSASTRIRDRERVTTPAS